MLRRTSCTALPALPAGVNLLYSSHSYCFLIEFMNLVTSIWSKRNSSLIFTEKFNKKGSFTLVMKPRDEVHEHLFIKIVCASKHSFCDDVGGSETDFMRFIIQIWKIVDNE